MVLRRYGSVTSDEVLFRGALSDMIRTCFVHGKRESARKNALRYADKSPLWVFFTSVRSLLSPR